MARLEKPKHTRFCFDILFQCTLHHCASTMFFLSRKKNLLAFWLLTKSVSRKVNITSRISANSFRGNSFLNLEIQVSAANFNFLPRKLYFFFAETIQEQVLAWKKRNSSSTLQNLRLRITQPFYQTFLNSRQETGEKTNCVIIP